MENPSTRTGRTVKSILVAEDDPIIGDLLVEALSLAGGWAARVVPDGAALLAAVACMLPDLILLDVGLPGLDGIAVYHLLREREGEREVPVLFVTADPGRVRRANLAGHLSILAKPFRVDVLVARAAQLMGEPQACASPAPTSSASRSWQATAR